MELTTELNKIEEVRRSPAFRDRILKYGTLKVIQRDDVLVAEHAYIRSIPIVLSGALRVTRHDEDGKELLLYYVKPGESCVMSFLGGIHNERSRIQAVAEDDTEVFILPIDESARWLKEFPEWTEYFMRIFMRRFEELLDVVNAVAFHKLDERLLTLLNRKSSAASTKTLTVTHQQLANDMGTSREVVSRLLKQLERDGKVLLSRNRIELVNA
jgi:CRP/FNR family transcriptional regulator, anaerobic regulatory protein